MFIHCLLPVVSHGTSVNCSVVVWYRNLFSRWVLFSGLINCPVLYRQTWREDRGQRGRGRGLVRNYMDDKNITQIFKKNY